jgi:hypothetical protein
MLERPPSRTSTLARATRRRELKRERHRRHRQRVKTGRMVALVELGGAELDWLVSVRWITAEEADKGDARVIGAAIAAGLAASAKG